eukprot:14519463-Alexandrium_andersonii.AAC.1
MLMFKKSLPVLGACPRTAKPRSQLPESARSIRSLLEARRSAALHLDPQSALPNMQARIGPSNH